MGVVTNLHKGKDGLVRSVSIRVPSGNELSRPIEKLYPLEVSDESNVHSNNKTDKGTIVDKEGYSCCSEGNSENQGTIRMNA